MIWYYGYARCSDRKPWTWVCKSVSEWDTLVKLIMTVRQPGAVFMVAASDDDEHEDARVTPCM